MVIYVLARNNVTLMLLLCYIIVTLTACTPKPVTLDYKELSTGAGESTNVSFIPPTLANKALIEINSTYVNLSINSSGTIQSVYINWNGTNYTVDEPSQIIIAHGDSNETPRYFKLMNGASLNPLSGHVGSGFNISDSANMDAYINFDSVNATNNITALNFAFMAWVYWWGNAEGNYGRIFSTDNSYRFIYNTALESMSFTWGTELLSANNGYPKATTYGKWWHVACIVNATDKFIMINGVRIATSTETATQKNLTVFYLGNYPTASRWCNCSIDEVHVYNRSFSEAEVVKMMNKDYGKYYINFTNLTNGVYTYYAYANASDGSSGQSATYTLNINDDDEAPTYSYNNTNLTTFTNATWVTSFAKWDDARLNYTWNSNNFTGSWINETPVARAGLTTINHTNSSFISAGCNITICWIGYANDTYGNKNQTGMMCGAIADCAVPPPSTNYSNITLPWVTPTIVYYNTQLNCSHNVRTKTSSTLGNVSFTWFRNGVHVTKYDVTVQNMSNLSQVNSTKSVNETLKVNNTWYCAASIYDGKNEGYNFSNIVTVLNSPPNTPTLLVSNNTVIYTTNSQGATMKWAGADPDNNTLSYFLNFGSCPPSFMNRTSLTSWTLYNLTSNANYCWSVKATDGQYNSTEVIGNFSVKFANISIAFSSNVSGFVMKPVNSTQAYVQPDNQSVWGIFNITNYYTDGMIGVSVNLTGGVPIGIKLMIGNTTNTNNLSAFTSTVYPAPKISQIRFNDTKIAENATCQSACEREFIIAVQKRQYSSGQLYVEGVFP